MASTPEIEEANTEPTTPSSSGKKSHFGSSKKSPKESKGEEIETSKEGKKKESLFSNWGRSINNLFGGKKTEEIESSSSPKNEKKKDSEMAKPKGQEQIQPPPGPPKWELVRNRDWLIENYHTEKEIKTLDNATLGQGVQVINCRDFRLDIKTKINSLTIDNCVNTNVQFVDLVGSLAIINCQKCNIQSTGVLPAVSVDNSGDIQIYVTNKSRGMTITTSMTGTVNVLIPPENGTEADDLVEMNIPAQFVHELKGDKVISKVSDLYR